MIALSLLGALLFYGFVYTLFNHYAQGKVFNMNALNIHQPFDVRLSPDAAILALKWLVVAVLSYMVLNYCASLFHRRGHRH